MAEPELAPRRSMGTVIAVWVVAAIAGVVIGVFVPPGWRPEWLVVAIGASLLLAFAIQLRVAEARGFIARVAMSVLGAAVVLGVISLGFGLASVVPG